MGKFFAAFNIILLVVSGCNPDVIKYTINGSIIDADGKYIKIIDMTRPGLAPDSIQLDMGGKFSFEKTSTQPGDYIFYFKNSDYIRVTPLPNETVSIQGDIYKLIESHEISGSPESEKVSQLIKMHHKSVSIIDTLNRFYMANQTNLALDTIIKRLTFISDSVYATEKKYLENYIENNPDALASYVALSQKLGPNKNFFTLKNDFKYFQQVDNALYKRFDTIDIVKMMHSYVEIGKIKLAQNTHDDELSLIGKTAPAIALPTIFGDTLTLASLKGKYVLVDFWASWCRPCRKENQNLNKVYTTYKNKGFEIFQVALERNNVDWKNCIKEDKLFWKYQVSELNYMNSQTAQLYNVKSLPANYLLNPEGVIIAQNIFGDSLQTKLIEIFALKPLPVVENEQ